MAEMRIRLEGSGPYGFRLFGGSGDPLVIAKIRKGSQAAEADLREGDLVMAVNGQTCADMTHAAAMTLVDNAGAFLDLQILRDETGSNFLSTPSLGYVAPPIGRSLSPTAPSQRQQTTFTPNSYANPTPSSNTWTPPESIFRTTGARVSSPFLIGQNQVDSFDVGQRQPMRQLNGDPGGIYGGEPANYLKEEHTSVDGNTLSKITRETESFGGTTLTKVTKQSYTSWDQPNPPRPPPSAEPVFRTTGDRSSPYLSPGGQIGIQKTFDLGRPLFSATTTKSDFSLSTSESTTTRPGVWAPSKHEPAPPRTWDLGNSEADDAKENLPSLHQTVSPLFRHKADGTLRPDDATPSWNAGLSTKIDVTAESSRPFPSPGGGGGGALFNVKKAVQPADTWKPSHVPAPPRPIPVTHEDSASYQPAPPFQTTPAKRCQSSRFTNDDDYSDGIGIGDSTEGSNHVTGARVSRGGSAFPDLPPNISKILSAPKGEENDYGGSSPFSKRKLLGDGGVEHQEKKVFGDSSFYADSKHLYPTMEEQVKMARIVAQSLTSGSNATARGHQMFLKRKEKADAWAVDADKIAAISAVGSGGGPKDSSGDSDLYYKPAPWNPSTAWKPSPDVGLSGLGGLGGLASKIPPPPPLPPSVLFVARPTDDKSKALSAEEFERVRLYGQKVTHDTISPQVCFNLARDLKENKGKGGRMFAKRRAKADQYTTEGQGHGPDPAMMMKLVGAHHPAPSKSPQPPSQQNNFTSAVDDVDYSLAPKINRLKEMIELPKAKMTPWDAVAEYGNVELAFDHLKDFRIVPGRPGSYADSVASTVRHQASQRKVEEYSAITPAPAGPPSWTRSVAETGLGGGQGFPQKNSAQFAAPQFASPQFAAPQSSHNSLATAPKFAPKVDFSSNSAGGGYKPVKFAAPKSGVHNQVFATGHGSSAGYSEF